MPPASAVTVLPSSTPLRSTATGTKALLLVLLPNWPELLAPQAASVPSAHNAKLWLPPAAMAMTRLPASKPLVSTATGRVAVVVELLPNWPLLLYPQAATVPSEHNARLWESPAATATTRLLANTPLRSTSTGSEEL